MFASDSTTVLSARSRLLRETSIFLTQEIPDSIRLYATKLPSFELESADFVAGESELEGLLVAHSPSSPFARYRVRIFGKSLDVYVQLNVARIAVVYYFPEDIQDKLEAIMGAVCPGGLQAGWEFKEYGLHESDYAAAQGKFFEFAAFMSLKPGFLSCPESRLFLSNDFAAMSRNILLNWSRLQQ